MSSVSRLALLGLLLSLLAGCGASVAQTKAVAPPRPAPSVITDATYDDALRHYLLLSREAPERAGLRDRLVEHLLAKGGAGAKPSYEATVSRLAEIIDLYEPSEFDQGPLPAALEPLARELVDKGSPRGDEARVLSGLLVLQRLHPDDKAVAEQYRKIKEWGFDSRAALGSPIERFEEGLLDVWEEHARLAPSPEVLSTLAQLYVERRNELFRLFQNGDRRMAPNPATIFEGLQRSAMSVAGVYLRHGDVASALASVKAMGAQAGVEQRLVEMLQTARDESSQGASALLDLARAYLEDGRPDVSRALCVTGLREQPEDARFPQCLARISATKNDFAGAMAWYSEAVRLMPEERALYDEILEVLSSLMEQGLFGSDTAQTRAIGNRAAEILEERLRRWPDAPPGMVKPEDLYLAIGVAEMNAGNATEAEARLRKSIATRETVPALLQLGLLLERMNRDGEAAEVYQRALQLQNGDRDDAPRKAEIFERLGDTLRMLGKAQEASKMYEQGLAIWDQNLSREKGQRIGLAQLRRGVLLGRLARRSDSLSAFEKAMSFAPEMRETYATILAYLAVTEPDSRFAQKVFHNALNQLSLEPEWKVYFALWVRMIAGRGGTQLDSDVSGLLEELAKGDDWWAKLARFATGKKPFDELLGEASDLGERTEAYFYEGARRLGSGNPEGAREMFEHVVQSKMVNFYEFAMAQELIAQTVASALPSKAQAPAQAAH